VIKLSVNVNKVATVRNSRGGRIPSVVSAVRACIDAGAPGITVHPRADERHITTSDVHAIASLLRDGENEISIVRNSGSGPIYFSAAAEFFSLEEPLKPAGNEIFVRRQYFKIVNHQTLLKGIVAERVPLNDGETVKSGDRVEVVLTVAWYNCVVRILLPLRIEHEPDFKRN